MPSVTKMGDRSPREPWDSESAGRARPTGTVGWPGHDNCLRARCPHHRALVTMRRDVHDQIGSSLAGMIMQVELVRRLIATAGDEVHSALADLHSELTELMAHTREIASQRGPGKAPRSVGTDIRSMIGRMRRLTADRLQISLQLDPDIDSLPPEVGRSTLLIVREAAVNVLKHSTARRCSVSVLVCDEELLIGVVDDGCPDRHEGPGGSGLTNMSGRAQEHGGWCVAGPVPPRGFAVVACVPLGNAMTGGQRLEHAAGWAKGPSDDRGR
ncbi:MAG TPA: histidine kinase [Streptosporangiaceae bacterium]|nr:histidine kinase [Streptosporangiaceae bacterium]